MPVAVVDIGPVGMGMRTDLVCMEVRMKSPGIEGRRILTVRMVMVAVIMTMAVLMGLGRMRMPMDVVFGDKEEASHQHKAGCDKEKRSRRVGKEEECKPYPEKWRE